MKALYFNEHGEAEVLRYGDVPDPVAGRGEVLVRVKACALNHLDIWVRKGWPGLELELPHWGGSDIAGVIEEVGEGVTAWKPGQRVVVDPGINPVEDEYTRNGDHSMSPAFKILGEHRRGGLAETIAVPASKLVEIPPGIDFPAAAAPILVTVTAWRMLINRAKLRAGESVLMVGAGGGVNSMAIQVARLAGATVYVVASNEEKGRRARELGAHHVIDRSKVNWGKEMFRLTAGRGVDVVVDNVGKATMGTSLKAVAPGGRIVIVGNTSGPIFEMDLRYIFHKQISIIGSTMGTPDDFGKVLCLLWSGALKPLIDVVMPLSEGREAFSRMEKSEQFGKIVVTP